MWHIWKARNNWTYNVKKVTELEVVQKALVEWIEFKATPTEERKKIEEEWWKQDRSHGNIRKLDV